MNVVPKNICKSIWNLRRDNKFGFLNAHARQFCETEAEGKEIRIGEC